MKRVLIGLILLILLFSGCTSREPVSPDNETGATNNNTNNTGEQKEPVQTKFQIGQTVTGEDLKFTLNSIEFKEAIDYSKMIGDYEYANTETAKEGSTFLIAEILVENIGTTDQIFSSGTIKILDEEGFAYDASTSSMIVFDDAMYGESIPVGGKKKGHLMWEVPKNQKITFRVELGLFNKKIAEYEINETS